MFRKLSEFLSRFSFSADKARINVLDLNFILFFVQEKEEEGLRRRKLRWGQKQ